MCQRGKPQEKVRLFKKRVVHSFDAEITFPGVYVYVSVLLFYFEVPVYQPDCSQLVFSGRFLTCVYELIVSLAYFWPLFCRFRLPVSQKQT